MRFLNNLDYTSRNEIPKTPVNIDTYIGQKLRDFREKAGLSLFECAQNVGVSHQQIHKRAYPVDSGSL